MREIARVRLVRARGRVIVQEERHEGDREHRQRDEPTAAHRHIERLAPELHALHAEQFGESFPHPHEPERRPHTPGGEAHDEEVIAVAHLARHVIAELGRLRIAVLEVQVADEQQREREHERARSTRRSGGRASSAPSRRSAPSTRKIAASAFCSRRRRAVRIAEPLPLEVEPPHAELPDERRLPVGERGLRVLHAVVDERLSERERLPGGGLALVDRREMRGADRLREERASCPAAARQRTAQHELPAEERLRAAARARPRATAGPARNPIMWFA